MDPKTIEKIANQPTRARRRAEAMGFTFTRIDAARSFVVDRSVSVRATFTCVCGRAEQFVMAVPDELLDSWVAIGDVLDIAAKLERIGSFSEKHLREDGYTEDQIADILRRGEQFDRDNPR